MNSIIDQQRDIQDFLIDPYLLHRIYYYLGSYEHKAVEKITREEGKRIFNEMFLYGESRFKVPVL